MRIVSSKKSVRDYQAELFSLKSKMLTVNKSVCNLDCAISSVQTCTQILFIFGIKAYSYEIN